MLNHLIALKTEYRAVDTHIFSFKYTHNVLSYNDEGVAVNDVVNFKSFINVNTTNLNWWFLLELLYLIGSYCIIYLINIIINVINRIKTNKKWLLNWLSKIAHLYYNLEM